MHAMRGEALCEAESSVKNASDKEKCRLSRGQRHCVSAAPAALAVLGRAACAAGKKYTLRRQALSLLAIVTLFLVGLFVAVPMASAYIPKVNKIRSAIVGVNQRSARGTGLRVEVALYSAAPDGSEEQPADTKALLAKGTLETLPSGLARLELRSPQGQVERHLLRGSEYLASRNGVMLTDARPFLFPAFLLQAGDSSALANGLASLGVAGEAVALGLLDDHDCYVIGGRVLGQHETVSERPALSSLWVDMNGFYFVAFEQASGVRYRFGPSAAFQGVQFPKWVSIEKPGQPAFYLEVQNVKKATLSASAFQADWVKEQPRLVPAN